MSQDPHRIAYWLLKDVDRAIREHGMIRSQERIAVAVSGGKDSLSLLHLLDWRRSTSPVPYELVAIHVQGDTRGRGTPPHPALTDWLQDQGYAYRVLPPHQASDETLPMGCQRCTWNRRRTLFEEAAPQDCTVLAFGHHADDLAQTTLINQLFHGRVETMAPVRTYFAGRLRLIRPLCYVAEGELRRFARACGFPPPPALCPQAGHSQRELVRGLLRSVGRHYPQVRANLLRSGLRYDKLASDTD